MFFVSKIFKNDTKHISWDFPDMYSGEVFENANIFVNRTYSTYLQSPSRFQNEDSRNLEFSV